MSKKNHDYFFFNKKEREATLIKTKKRACLGLENQKRLSSTTNQVKSSSVKR